MKSIKKRLLSLTTALALSATMFSGASAFALEWGAEWENESTGIPAAGTVVTTQVPVATQAPVVAPAPAVTTQPQQAVQVVETPLYGSFRDVPTTHWAYNAVERCKATHWFDGYPDGSFRPDGEILRSEALKVFVVFDSLPLETVTTSSYIDVDVTKWYAPYIEAGKELFPDRNTTQGQKKFQPEMPVTREDTIYAIVKMLGYDQLVPNADESVLNMFADQNSISEALRPYIAVAVSNGLASGYNDNTLRAQDPLTRAQFATLLYRASGIGKLATAKKVLKEVVIEPTVLKEINIGESFEITAKAIYTDGSEEDFTNNLNPYTDSIEGVVTINKNKVNGVGAGTILINYNCEEVKDETLVVIVKDPNPAPTTTPEPTVEPTTAPDPAKAGLIKGVVDKEVMTATQKVKRYTVLSMDVSGSMYGDKMKSAQAAAKLFCETVLGEGQDDYIAIVEYESSSRVVCNFTNDLTTLNNCIDNLYASGNTNIHDGMQDAEKLLDDVTDADVLAKSIVVLTDGYPCAGPTNYQGKYVSNEWTYANYANPIYERSQQIIGKSYDIYTIGFYTGSVDTKVEDFLTDIQNKGYFLADDVDSLSEIFRVIGNKIIVSGVNVELKDGDDVIDSCKTTAGACEFQFTVDAGTYTLVVSAPGYETVEKQVEIKTGETTKVDDICLKVAV